ncbi:hypothetical protein AMECASPLE_005233 [Ameca splendens]|uniref:Uncharacterized protein n=1 Tax=Ameca splendens TaxID=208324 RepID=A0ABV0XZ25_9TELE
MSVKDGQPPRFRFLKNKQPIQVLTCTQKFTCQRGNTAKRKNICWKEKTYKRNTCKRSLQLSSPPLSQIPAKPWTLHRNPPQQPHLPPPPRSA